MESVKAVEGCLWPVRFSVTYCFKMVPRLFIRYYYFFAGDFWCTDKALDSCSRGLLKLNHMQIILFSVILNLIEQFFQFLRQQVYSYDCGRDKSTSICAHKTIQTTNLAQKLNTYTYAVLKYFDFVYQLGIKILDKNHRLSYLFIYFGFCCTSNASQLNHGVNQGTYLGFFEK